METLTLFGRIYLGPDEADLPIRMVRFSIYEEDYLLSYKILSDNDDLDQIEISLKKGDKIILSFVSNSLDENYDRCYEELGHDKLNVLRALERAFGYIVGDSKNDTYVPKRKGIFFFANLNMTSDLMHCFERVLL